MPKGNKAESSVQPTTTTKTAKVTKINKFHIFHTSTSKSCYFHVLVIYFIIQFFFTLHLTCLHFTIFINIFSHNPFLQFSQCSNSFENVSLFYAVMHRVQVDWWWFPLLFFGIEKCKFKLKLRSEIHFRWHSLHCYVLFFCCGFTQLSFSSIVIIIIIQKTHNTHRLYH